MAVQAGKLQQAVTFPRPPDLGPVRQEQLLVWEWPCRLPVVVLSLLLVQASRHFRLPASAVRSITAAVTMLEAQI